MLMKLFKGIRPYLLSMDLIRYGDLEEIAYM